MRIKFVLFLVAVLISAGAVTPPGLVAAQRVTTQVENARRTEETSKPVAEPKVFVTPHSGRFGNELVAYTATAGETYLLDDKGEPKASIFSFAYVKDGVKG